MGGDAMVEIRVVRHVDAATLRTAVQKEYAEVARHPDKGFHFHTGRPLAKRLGYSGEWLERVPESALESFAGTGDPFALGEIRPGERVLDVGCGAGFDSFLTAGSTRKTGPSVKAIQRDMNDFRLNYCIIGIGVGVASSS
jgi:cyclopropane fatty-acyl-phospholipid synthase-like methyltransferase